MADSIFSPRAWLGGACSAARSGSRGSPPDLFEQRRELRQDVAVELALERHDETRQLRRRDPLPGVELGMVRGKVDVAVAPGEAHGEPFLHLAAITAAPEPSRDLLRHVIAQPPRGFRQEFRVVGTGLFLELAQGRLARRLALVDAALRHLPIVAFHVDAAADEDTLLRVEQHHAHAGAIALGARRFDVVRHRAAPWCSPGKAASALTGARARPFSSSVFAHAATRSIVAG